MPQRTHAPREPVVRVFASQFVLKTVTGDTENDLIRSVFNRRKFCANIGYLPLCEKPFHSFGRLRIEPLGDGVLFNLRRSLEIKSSQRATLYSPSRPHPPA
jgi:hypothetical protein